MRLPRFSSRLRQKQSLREVGPASAEKAELLLSDLCLGLGNKRLLFSCERTQSVGPSIHPAYPIYSYSLFGQKKLPCIDDLTANDELTNSHNLTCLPWGRGFKHALGKLREEQVQTLLLRNSSGHHYVYSCLCPRKGTLGRGLSSP